MTDLSQYSPRPIPGKCKLIGRFVCLEPMDWKVHGNDLANAITGTRNDGLWSYIGFGPFEGLTGMQNVMSYLAEQLGWKTMAIVRRSDNKAVGTASFMRIRPEHGSAELGCIIFSKELQRTAAATETIYLMSAHLFDDLDYRRNEWKCDNGNKPSKRAAERFGYLYEGVFRNDLVVKGKNRDTAWYAMTNNDWPAIKAGFQTWLSANNFDTDGVQKQSLSECRI